MRIAIINESTLIDERAAQFVTDQIRLSLADFVRPWDLKLPAVEHARPGEEQAEIDEPDPCVIVLLDDSDQAGALGYHALTPDGKPYAAVFVADSFTGLSGQPRPTQLTLAQVGQYLVQVVDHEAKEAVLDPDASDMVPDGTGLLWAREACDAVESDVRIHQANVDGNPVNVALSAYLLPAYFRPGSAGPWDSNGVLTGPFTIARDGYAIVEEGGKVSQRFGDGLAGWRRLAHTAAFAAAAGSTATASRTGWCVVGHAFHG